MFTAVVFPVSIPSLRFSGAPCLIHCYPIHPAVCGAPLVLYGAPLLFLVDLVVSFWAADSARQFLAYHPLTKLGIEAGGSGYPSPKAARWI
jgi:hypothetical protein